MDRVIGSSPVRIVGSLLAGAEEILGSFVLGIPRTFSATCRVAYHASATTAVRVRFFFSPDGKNYDTVDYTFFDVVLTAGAVVQQSKLVDVPEGGEFRVSVLNKDGTYAASNVAVWVTSQDWPRSG